MDEEDDVRYLFVLSLRIYCNSVTKQTVEVFIELVLSSYRYNVTPLTKQTVEVTGVYLISTFFHFVSFIYIFIH